MKTDDQTYLLRDIPRELHVEAKRRSDVEGRTLRWVLIQALHDWTEGRWIPGKGKLRDAR